MATAQLHLQVFHFCALSNFTKKADIVRPGDVYQLWSMMSGSGDQYVCKTDQTIPGDPNVYVVNGSGKANQVESIAITFARAQPVPGEGRRFYMKFFESQGGSLIPYTIHASQNAIVAVKNPGSDANMTMWKPTDLPRPVEGYFVLKSDKQNSDGKPLFLSCDGLGRLKLKPSKHDPRRNDFVDVSLLFRAVDPEE